MKTPTRIAFILATLLGCGHTEQPGSASDPQTTAQVVMSDISFFDQKTLSYTYDNGWSFTNFFDGHTRISKVAKRGVLREKVVVQQIGDGVWFVAWEDEHMGPISQMLDFNTNRLWAAVKFEGEVQIWPGKITGFGEEGRPEGID